MLPRGHKYAGASDGDGGGIPGWSHGFEIARYEPRVFIIGTYSVYQEIGNLMTFTIDLRYPRQSYATPKLPLVFTE